MATFTPTEIAAAVQQMNDLLTKVSIVPDIVMAEHCSGVASGYAQALTDLGLLSAKEGKQFQVKAQLAAQCWTPVNLR